MDILLISEFRKIMNVHSMNFLIVKLNIKMLDLSEINKSWTLFLDRDGVINVDKSPYTLNAEEFEFFEGVPEAIKKFSDLFGHIFIVTNQRGVGRKLMPESDLLEIHDKMLSGINKAGGRIDKIYYCTAVDNADPNRKPNPGMAFQAMHEHPSVIAHHSIMVGNNITDMLFGKNAGLHTVLVNSTGTHVHLPHPLVDLQFRSLVEFSDALSR